jgi:single-stranded-DNA-specific exonuclease
MTHPIRWNISPLLTPQANESLSGFPPVLRQVLFNRGYASEVEAKAFLKAETIFEPSPLQLKGMQATVERIQHAIAEREPVVIYGDYDVDGVTATALLVQVLKALGAEVRPYIPNRFDEGYGLNNEALDSLAGEGAKVVISVDCGIRSPEEARHARTLGLDLIITDHHEPAGELPEAFAIINPKQEGDPYPEKYLAGVGVAYKIAQALFAAHGTTTTDSPASSVNGLALDDLLDLVALGTVADLAPLTGENRTLVRAGLMQMRQTKRLGLFSLANVAGVSLPVVNATHIGFMLGPRLNAAGRLESAMAALDLLTATDMPTAGRLAQMLDGQNRERQALTRKIQAEADTLAMAEDPGTPILFAVHPEFNPGVVGLAAARLVESHYLPAVVGQRSEETTRCSCRSIPEFHITAALDQCADLLVRHGGHAAAAGFTVRNENLEALKERLTAIAREQLAGLDLRRTLTADLEIPLNDLRSDLLKQLETLQPTGYGNPEAVFVTRNLQVKNSRTVGMDSKHLKLTLSDGRLTLDAIGFRLGHLLENLPGRIDILYTFESNEYNGRSSLQLNLKDVKPAGLPD